MDASAKPLAANTSFAASSSDERVEAARVEGMLTPPGSQTFLSGLRRPMDGTADAVIRRRYRPHVSQYRLTAAAQLLGVSDDTLRRWADAGRLDTALDADGKRVVAGEVLAAFAVDLAG